MIGDWNNGTGRRKSSVARVFLKKGSGKITVNGKAIDEFFGRQTSIMICKQPLVLTDNLETFDVQVNVRGGGESGQAGAVRHGIAAAVGRRFRDARRARGRAQEGRPALRSPAQAVQQALIGLGALAQRPRRLPGGAAFLWAAW